MSAQLIKTKETLQAMLDALRNTAKALPQRGCLEDFCQRQAFLNATYQLDLIISNFSVDVHDVEQHDLNNQNPDISISALNQLMIAQERIVNSVTTPPIDNKTLNVILSDGNPQNLVINGTPIHPNIFTQGLSEFHAVEREVEITELQLQAVVELEEHSACLICPGIEHLQSITDPVIFVSLKGNDFVAKSTDPARFNAIAKILLELSSRFPYKLPENQSVAS